MRYSSLVGHAAEALDTVWKSRRPADVLMQDFFAGRRYLGARDRREISAMVFDVLRRSSYLWALWRAARLEPADDGRPAVPMFGLLFVRALVVCREDAVRMREGFEAFWKMSVRTPPLEQAMAAVMDAERTFVPPVDPAARLALLYSLPAAVAGDWVERFGEAEAERLCAASNAAAPTTIRVNTLLCTVEECRAALHAEGVEALPTPYSPVGLTLARRIHAGSLKTFRAGWFEMQDEGSQLLSYLVHPGAGDTIVDACAGGGGKTLHLAALMGNRGSILALDISAGRLKNLRERAGRARVRIASPALAGEARVRAMAGKADTVLIDAPCTGTGTFRRNPGAKSLFNTEVLEGLAHTQERLLEEYMSMVRPGGRLVYSTCSLLRRENMVQVEAFLGRHTDFRLVTASDILKAQGIDVPASGPVLELLPHLTGTDGFFAAVMQRTGGE